MGSKKISDLDTILNANIAIEDYLILNDDSETSVDKTKRVTIEELDKRYHNETDYDTAFDNRLNTKSTTDLAEGINLYYTQLRFDDAFDAKSTTDLSEGDNLYYTESRVSSNLTVAANTSKRHNILTLDTSATDAGLSLDDQELSHTKATASVNGYLASTDFATFNGKADRSNGDISEGSFSISEDVTGSTAITGFSFDVANVRAFEALISIEIDSDTNLFEVVKVSGIIKDNNVVVSRNNEDYPSTHIGDNTGVEITFAIAGGTTVEAKYISGLYTNFVSGTIRFRAETLNY